MKRPFARKAPSRRSAFVLLLVLLTVTACRREKAAAPEPPKEVTSHLEGQLTVSKEVDPVPDYSGFEVLVATRDSVGNPDTLGFATTDTSGAFRLTVTAPERGVYPLVISRRGTMLTVGDLAVADGDSATITAVFPLENRMLRVRSKENAAWMAYRNTKAQYNQSMLQLMQQGGYQPDDVRLRVNQTSAILWSLQENYPGTIGGEIATAESVIMLDGWDDSLLVQRARVIDVKNPNLVDVVRAARRAQARLGGQQAALALIREFEQKVEDRDVKAGIESEVVVAYADSLRQQDALAAARALKEEYGDTEWATWADRAIYEIENLSPGMAAPSFQVVTTDGRPLLIENLRGRLVVLEFYQPADPEFQQQLPARNGIVTAVGPDTLLFVSISLDPDTMRNVAFHEGRLFPGIHVIAPLGLQSQVARAYNVHTLPTRVLVDQNGNIVRKYVGSTLARLQEDLIVLLRGPAQAQPPA